MWECYNKNMTNRTTLTETEIIFTNTQRVARLATADLDGHPHIVPVCYAYDGTHFYIPLDEKPKKVDESKLRRVRNIEARHEASLLIDQYDDDWSRLGYVLVHGHAGLIQSDRFTACKGACFAARALHSIQKHGVGKACSDHHYTG